MTRVLIIDDSPEILVALEICLRYSGFDVEVAATFPEAEGKLRSLIFDLVLCDVRMPGMTGLEFQEKLAREVLLPPFLFCTGMGVEDFPPPYPVGVVGFMAKPFAVHDLVKKIQEILISYRPKVSV